MSAQPRNRAELTAEVAAAPDEVFTYLTDHFSDLWPGKHKVITAGDDPAEPMGLGMVRTIKPAGLAGARGADRHPRTPAADRVHGDQRGADPQPPRPPRADADGYRHAPDYSISFDYEPAAAGPLVARMLQTTWALTGRRRMRADLGRL